MSDLKRPGQHPGLLRVTVLGGYGLIGAAVMARLTAAGHQVAGIGRSERQARRSAPQAPWKIVDIATLPVEGWQDVLKDIDVVVNASGALQSGARDDLTGIHVTALERIGTALSRMPQETLFVQISAAGVSEDSSTEFFRSKAKGEAAFRATGQPMVILRPTLVMAPGAYGGTALLRAAASLPVVLPKVLPRTTLQCVHIDDLSQAVLDAVEGRIAPGVAVDVTGAGAQSLPDLLETIRCWLGFAPAGFRLSVPGFALNAISALADVAGFLGWRSPLRRTAVRVLQDGVSGDAGALQQAGGTPCRGLGAIFQTLPATLQDRWFARAYLLFPLAVVTLSLFWFLSGAIGLVSFGAAQSVLTSRGWGEGTAGMAVAAGAFVDMALGLMILWRPLLRQAALGMIAVSLAYLLGASLSAPDLWLDPLGPLVKVLPGMMLALFVLAFSGER